MTRVATIHVAIAIAILCSASGCNPMLTAQSPAPPGRAARLDAVSGFWGIKSYRMELSEGVAIALTCHHGGPCERLTVTGEEQIGAHPPARGLEVPGRPDEQVRERLLAHHRLDHDLVPGELRATVERPGHHPRRLLDDRPGHGVPSSERRGHPSREVPVQLVVGHVGR